MLGISIKDWLTYTNVAYLISLLLTFALTATLWRVSVAAQNASENELEKYKADGQVKVSQANAQADLANNEAAGAKLETERLRAMLQWRKLEDPAKSLLIDRIRNSANKKVHISWVFGDPESMWLGQQYAMAFQQAGWVTTAQVIPLTNTISTGISIPIEPTKMNTPLREAFTNSGIAVASYGIPDAVLTLGSPPLDDEATIFIGIRQSAIALP